LLWLAAAIVGDRSDDEISLYCSQSADILCGHLAAGGIWGMAMNANQMDVLAEIVDLHCTMVEIGDALSISVGEYRQGNLEARQGVCDMVLRLETSSKLMAGLAQKLRAAADRN
jgi:hypothetical protein